MKNKQEKPLEYYVPEVLRIDTEKPKKFLTKSGKTITVSKETKHLSGVGKSTYFCIESDGQIFKPLQSIGVKNFIQRN